MDRQCADPYSLVLLSQVARGWAGKKGYSVGKALMLDRGGVCFSFSDTYILKEKSQ